MTLNEILAANGRKLEDITKIYRGLDNHCRCGCGGVYHYKGAKGYTRAINTMNKETFNEDSGFEMCDIGAGRNYINIPYDYEKDLCYCVYFD